MFVGCDVCEGRTISLVRYPTTLAPVNGSVTVTVQCVDNAHSINNTLNVTCTNSGNWTGTPPNCQCNDGYHKTTQNGRQMCQGE